MDVVTGLNLSATLMRQENKCYQCKKEIRDHEVYFRMDQKINIYEVYCSTCGEEKSIEDREIKDKKRAEARE